MHPSVAQPIRKYIVYGIGIFVTIAAVYLAATDGQGGGIRIESKLGCADRM